MIELLVVILIISVLAALTTAAVIQVTKSGKRVTAVNEISQLDVVLAKFKQDFGFYPPSHVGYTDSSGVQRVKRFRVPTNVNEPEYFLLKRMFPRWTPISDASGNIATASLPGGAGNQLDGNQCLVFFLAGPTGTGWDPNNPIAANAAASNKKGPYFDFQANRLVGGRYLDPWGVPYAYFSSNAGNDTYDPRAQFPWAADPAPETYAPALESIAALAPEATETTFRVHPYRAANGKWLNPGKFQIISAGPDQRFGAGSYVVSAGPPAVIRDWTPGAPGTEYLSTNNDPVAGVNVNFGYDDLANFNGGSNLGETGNQ
jgi:type II secretory pathway pseudopilin PulG